MNWPTKSPKVSVCVVTYNQERYIRQCLQSIVDQQTDFAFEVIVGDDCSTDETRAIVREFEERYPGIVKPIYQPSNIDGGFKNFLDVHAAASGEYIAHVDGDDYCLPNKLQRQADFLDANPDFAVVWHRVNFINDEGAFFSGEDYDYSMFSNGVVSLRDSLRFGTVATHSSIMYRKSARKTYWPNFPTLDLFFTWEYLSAGAGKILDEVLGVYRVNSSGSISSTRKLMVSRLCACHANYYYSLYPSYRRDIFIFALTNLLADLKNFRKTSILFLMLSARTFSYVSFFEFYKHLKAVRKLRIPLYKK